jgi:signal transduction histidine kinase
MHTAPPPPPTSTVDSPPPRGTLHAFLVALSLRRVGLTLLLAVIAALMISPIFVTPTLIVVGRFMVIAAVLLVLFTAAGVWRQSVLPAWLLQVIVVMAAAPLMTFIVYLPAVGGDIAAVFKNEGRLQGFVSITATTMIWGALLALGALYRERDAQARCQQLEFELERSALEKQAVDARLKLLHAQIEPHFLFNTLANVQTLVESGSPRASPVLKNLIAYLRAAMPQLSEADATLNAEAKLVRAYLELMQMRMPDRLTFAVNIAPELANQRFPSMALLTLVENAIHHGIDPSEQGGHIDVGAQRDAASGEVQVWVADSGAGMSDKAQQGTGLTNLRARLSAFYGPSARLELLEQAPHGLRAQIVFSDKQPAEAS